jgi:LacI family transcriptional regulator, galactose operon repressor
MTKNIHKKSATIRDVAKEAGVSTMTVTRAFRSNALITEKTRKRVTEVADRLNFIPNSYARGLRGSSSMSVGILISNPFGNPIVRALSLSLLKANYVSYVADSLSDMQIVKSGLRDFCSRKVTGVILQWRNDYKEDSRLMYLLRHLHNVVLYANEPVENIEFDVCALDFLPAYKEAVSLLWNAGRRKIIYLGHGDMWPCHTCLNILENYGLAPAKCLVKTSSYPSKPAFANYYDALHDRILHGEIPDVIFTQNDVAAAQACACLKTHGLRVPEDTAVIGSGNMDLSPFCSPAIASIDKSNNQVAELIYDMLIKRINQPDAELQYKKVNGSYISRESAAVNIDLGQEG